MKSVIALAGCALALTASLAAAADASKSTPSPLGRWVTASGNLEVEVAPCGDALCGTVVRVLANRSMSRSGEEMKPADPRDPMGMQILSGFAPSDDPPTRWEGTIYNRENAKTYRCKMWIGDTGELMLHAYVGISWFGRTSTWTRATPATAEAR